MPHADSESVQRSVFHLNDHIKLAIYFYSDPASGSSESEWKYLEPKEDPLFEWVIRKLEQVLKPMKKIAVKSWLFCGLYALFFLAVVSNLVLS